MEYYQHRERIDEFKDPEYQDKETQDILEFALYGATSLATLEDKTRNEHYARGYVKSDVVALFKYGSGRSGLTLCTETLPQPAIQAGWEQFFNDEQIPYSPPLTPEFIWENLVHNTKLLENFPTDFAERLLRAHIAHMEKLQQEFEANELPLIMAQVDEKITRAIHNQILPITLDHWERVKNQTKIIVMDTIKNDGDTQGIANGPVIQITPDAPLDVKAHVTIHEFIHRLDGQIINKTTITGTNEDGETETDIDYDKVRAGLLFTTTFHKPPKRQWINEAVTEDMAMAVNEQEYSEFYETERQLLEMLTQSLGPSSRELLRSVYFEDPRIGPERKLENYRALTRLVSKKLGTGFLNKLEKFVHGQRGSDGAVLSPDDGAEIAAIKWEKVGDQFPEYLTEWCKQRREITQLALDLIKTVKAESPEALSKLDKYSSFKVYEEIWNVYFKPKVPKPSQYLVVALHDLVIDKLSNTTKRAAYRAKFGIGDKNESPAQPG